MISETTRTTIDLNNEGATSSSQTAIDPTQTREETKTSKPSATQTEKKFGYKNGLSEFKRYLDLETEGGDIYFCRLCFDIIESDNLLSYHHPAFMDK